MPGRIDRLQVAVFHPGRDDDEVPCGQHGRRMVAELVAEFAADAVEELDLLMRVPERPGRRKGLEVPNPRDPSESEVAVLQIGRLLSVRVFRHAADDSKRFRKSPRYDF